MLLKRPHELKSTRYIVVSDDKRYSDFLMNVRFDSAKLFEDALMRPAFEGTAKVYADNFPQDTCIYPFEIVSRKSRHNSSNVSGSDTNGRVWQKC